MEIDTVLDRMAGLLHDFPHHAQVHAVQLTLEPWIIENGLILPTMKLKRAAIEGKFAEKIRRLYAGRATVF